MTEVISSAERARQCDPIRSGRIKLARNLSVLMIPVAFSGLCCPPPMFAQAPRQDQASRTGQAVLPGPSDNLLVQLEGIYKDIHANPELSMQERRTAGIAAKWLREQGYEVTEEIGKTGVVGLLRNGEGATRILAQNKDKWHGTVMALFQPAEETGEGAQAMLHDGLMQRFPKPDVAFAQHVLPLRAGQIAIRSGLFLSQSNSLAVTLFGKGGHGSSPETTIDPVVMAASTVMLLQTVVSRDIGATDDAVLSVGSIQAGSSANIIPGKAVIQLNIRTFNDQVRDQVLSSATRIINGVATTFGAPQPPRSPPYPVSFP